MTPAFADLAKNTKSAASAKARRCIHSAYKTPAPLLAARTSPRMEFDPVNVFKSLFCACLLTVAAGCEAPAKQPAPSPPPPTQTATPATPSSTPSPPPAAASNPSPPPTPEPSHAHAPLTHTPEEGCPLQKAGVNPDHLRPFEDTAKYIAHLEREDRAAWQQPDTLIAALSLRPDEVVADLGAGSGYFSFRIAKMLPSGRVIALDVDPEMIRHVHHKTMTESIPNVQASLADPNTPTLPPDTSLALVVDVLHHVPNQSAWVAHVAQQLKPNARLAIVEFKMGDVPVGPPESHKIPKQTLIDMAQAAGLTLANDLDSLLPYQNVLIFQKPTPSL